jgi:hypothetical protein
MAPLFGAGLFLFWNSASDRARSAKQRRPLIARRTLPGGAGCEFDVPVVHPDYEVDGFRRQMIFDVLGA